jgi:hypothetical protein
LKKEQSLKPQLLKAYRYFRLKLEAFIWLVALIAFAFMPVQDEHYSLCFFHHLGIGFCPGCGLGHSISYFFHGDIQASLHTHPLGIIVIIVLLIRAIKILFFQKDYQLIKS